MSSDNEKYRVGRLDEIQGRCAMDGTVSTRRTEIPAVLVCVALCAVAACGAEVRAPTAPTPPPTASTPPTTPTPPAVWTDLGEYTLALAAAPSCSLPDYAMAQTYDARLKESGQRLAAETNDSHCYGWGWPCGFSGNRDGATVRFTLSGHYPGADGYAFSHEVNADTELAYLGTATGIMGDRGVAAAFDGAVILYRIGNFTEVEFARCDAPDHRLELVRK